MLNDVEKAAGPMGVIVIVGLAAMAIGSALNIDRKQPDTLFVRDRIAHEVAESKIPKVNLKAYKPEQLQTFVLYATQYQEESTALLNSKETYRSLFWAAFGVLLVVLFPGYFLVKHAFRTKEHIREEVRKERAEIYAKTNRQLAEFREADSEFMQLRGRYDELHLRFYDLCPTILKQEELIHQLKMKIQEAKAKEESAQKNFTAVVSDVLKESGE